MEGAGNKAGHRVVVLVVRAPLKIDLASGEHGSLVTRGCRLNERKGAFMRFTYWEDNSDAMPEEDKDKGGKGSK